jgi:hypothetical protein
MECVADHAGEEATAARGRAGKEEKATQMGRC